MTSLKVHHLEESRSQRLLWLLEELGLDYELVSYARHPKTKRAPKALRAVHPLGRSPVLEHDGLILAESGAIMEYVVETFGEGQLRPTDAEGLRRYRFFLHFAEGSMMAPLLVRLIMSQVKKAVPILGGIIAGQVGGAYSNPEIASQLDFVEDELEGREWLAGELSAADINMSYPLENAFGGVADAAEYPNIRAYLARIAARPAHQRALERGA